MPTAIIVGGKRRRSKGSVTRKQSKKTSKKTIVKRKSKKSRRSVKRSRKTGGSKKRHSRKSAKKSKKSKGSKKRRVAKREEVVDNKCSKKCNSCGKVIEGVVEDDKCSHKCKCGRSFQHSAKQQTGGNAGVGKQYC